MTDRHKNPPIAFRPPDAERAWLLAHAAETGKPVNAVLTEALAAYRKRTDRFAARSARNSQ